MFEPSFSVEKIVWPAEIERLESCASRVLDGLIEGIESSVDENRKVIGFASEKSGSGCTFITLAVARLLALRGIKTFLADARCSRPAIANYLNLAPEFGWEDAYDQSIPLEDAVIESQTEPLAVLPLINAVNPAMLDFPKLIETIRSSYDVILLDLGTESHSALEAIDSILLIRDCREEKHTEHNSHDEVPVLGLVENFFAA